MQSVQAYACSSCSCASIERGVARHGRARRCGTNVRGPSKEHYGGGRTAVAACAATHGGPDVFHLYGRRGERGLVRAVACRGRQDCAVSCGEQAKIGASAEAGHNICGGTRAACASKHTTASWRARSGGPAGRHRGTAGGGLGASACDERARNGLRLQDTTMRRSRAEAELSMERRLAHQKTACTMRRSNLACTYELLGRLNRPSHEARRILRMAEVQWRTSDQPSQQPSTTSSPLKI